MPEVHCEYGENSVGTESISCVPRFTVDLVTMELRLPLEKLKVIRAEARKLQGVELVSARALACLLGKMNATTQVIPHPPVLSPSAEGSLSSTEGVSTGLRNDPQDLTRRQEQIDLVGHTDGKMEWEINS